MLKKWQKRGQRAVHTKYKKMVLVFIALVIALVGGLGITGGSVVSAAEDPDTNSSNFSSGVATCAIQSVGWVICPTMRTIAQLADYGFAFINENFLRIEYEITTTDSGIFIAWSLIRNIANIILVLAFLYIVYTQITGRNTGEYNLKRILPRLILGAILLNLSYYVCAAAIQASNILGSATLDIMVDVANRVGTPAMQISSGATDGYSDGVLTNLVSTMLGKNGVVWVMMAPMAAVTVAIATISAAALLLLIARKVVVSMLVLVSPLLFVAYLLPNLEHFFQQWLRLFLQLLLLYPVIAFLLGAGQIVSATIISVGSGGDSNYSVQNDGYQARNGGSGSASTDLAAAGAAVLPLLGVWWIMKGLSNVMTTAGTRITAGVSRGRSGAQTEKVQAKLEKPHPTNANNVNIMGGKVNIYDRKPAFRRSRRRATPGASALTQGEGKPGGAKATPTAAAPKDSLDPFDALGTEKPFGNKDDKKPNEQQLAEIDEANTSAALVAANLAQESKKEKKTANDYLEGMNQWQRPQNKDSQPSSGGSSGQASGGGSAQAGGANPASNVHAPRTTQSISVPAQNSPAAPQRIVAVPVQIDTSALTGGAPAQPQARATAPHQAPVSDMQQKAKGIANQYLFDSARDVDEASQQLDKLSEKPANDPTEDDKSKDT